MRLSFVRMLALVVAGVLPQLTSAQPEPGNTTFYGRTVTCQSEGYSYRECLTGFGGPARMVERLSDTRCDEGHTWGNVRDGVVWVRDGCRARFAARDGDGGYNGDSSYVTGTRIRCESQGGAYNECAIGGRYGARLIRQLSDARCEEGRSWGVRGDRVWVDRGCRAEFEITRRGGGDWDRGQRRGYSVVCESRDGEMNVCDWDRFRGQPRVGEQLSSARCEEGRSWGMQNRNQIWVDRGCRARFVPR